MSSSGRIRVCIVMGSHWEVQMGGAQYQARCLLELLEQDPRFEIFYVAHLVPELRSRPGYTIVPFASGKRRGPAQFLPHLPSLYRTLKALRPDVIYQRGLKSYSGACALYARRHGARFIFHAAHDDDVRQQKSYGPILKSIFGRLERLVSEYGLHRTDAIVVQTGDQKRFLKAEYGLDAKLIVRNFHPLTSQSARPTCSGVIRIIWVANFKASKNPEIFVRLAQFMADRQNAEFVMIGRSGEARVYAELHKTIESLPNLTYMGELPVERVNEELARSDLFVNTSTAEGFANTFIQAWLRGVPVVSCFVDPDQCLTRGGGGVFAGSEERLREVITELLADPEKLESLKQTAREYGYANHTPRQAALLIELLAVGAIGHDGEHRNPEAAADPVASPGGVR